LEKYRANFKIDESQGQEVMPTYAAKIESFDMFLKAAEVTMKTNKDKLKAFAEAHDRMTQSYQTTYANWIKYEEVAVEYFSNSDAN